MPASTPNARKRGAAAMPTSERKRAKLQDALTIAVQNTEQALRTGELDVPWFIKSRGFEIDALQNAMKASKESSNKRPFQIIPGDIRRRKASHNVKGVPKLLRPRAAREMKSDNTPMVSTRRRKDFWIVKAPERDGSEPTNYGEEEGYYCSDISEDLGKQEDKKCVTAASEGTD